MKQLHNSDLSLPKTSVLSSHSPVGAIDGEQEITVRDVLGYRLEKPATMDLVLETQINVIHIQGNSTRPALQQIKEAYNTGSSVTLDRLTAQEYCSVD